MYYRVQQIFLEEDGDRADGQRRVRRERGHGERRERGQRRASHPALDRRGLRASRAVRAAGAARADRATRAAPSRPAFARLERRARRAEAARSRGAAATVCRRLHSLPLCFVRDCIVEHFFTREICGELRRVCFKRQYDCSLEHYRQN